MADEIDKMTKTPKVHCENHSHRRSKKMTDLSRSTIYRLMDKRGFLNRIALSTRSVT